MTGRMNQRQKVEIVFKTGRPAQLSWLKRFAEKCLKDESLQRKGQLLIVFVDNQKIQEINRQFFGRDRSTDVIAFSYNAEEETWGEIIISIDRAEEQAREYGVTLQNEVARLAVHGILHLAGYEDETDELKSVMHCKEDEYLAKYQKLITE